MNIHLPVDMRLSFPLEMVLTPHVLHHCLCMLGACPCIGEMWLSMCRVECQSQFALPRPKACLSFGTQLLGALSFHDRIGKSRLVLSRAWLT
jgi:hypothetical protein